MRTAVSLKALPAIIVLAVLAYLPYVPIEVPGLLPGRVNGPGSLQLLATCLVIAGIACVLTFSLATAPAGMTIDAQLQRHEGRGGSRQPGRSKCGFELCGDLRVPAIVHGARRLAAFRLARRRRRQ